MSLDPNLDYYYVVVPDNRTTVVEFRACPKGVVPAFKDQKKKLKIRVIKEHLDHDPYGKKYYLPWLDTWVTRAKIPTHYVFEMRRTSLSGGKSLGRFYWNFIYWHIYNRSMPITENNQVPTTPKSVVKIPEKFLKNLEKFTDPKWCDTQQQSTGFFWNAT